MKKRLFFTLLATIFAACAMSEVVDNTTPTQPTQPTRPSYIYIDFDEQTRVELDSEKKTIWSENDKVVRIGTRISEVWKYTGLTGEDTDRFDFFEELQNNNNHDHAGNYYVMYPYDNYVGISYAPDGPELLHKINATQQYTPNTYDPTSNVMLGSSDNGEIFSISNLVGYVHIPIKGDKSVSKIVLTGNNNEILAGNRSVALLDFNTTSWMDNTSKSITLNCNKGVQLSETATEFYITVVPTIFSKGFSLEIFYTNNTNERFNLSNKTTVERNRILRLNVINTMGPEPEPGDNYKQEITIKHIGSMVAFPILDALQYKVEWGDGEVYMVNAYELTSPLGPHLYIDDKASHTISVKSDNSKTFTIKSCTGISEIDLSKF